MRRSCASRLVTSFARETVAAGDTSLFGRRSRGMFARAHGARSRARAATTSAYDSLDYVAVPERRISLEDDGSRVEEDAKRHAFGNFETFALARSDAALVAGGVSASLPGHGIVRWTSLREREGLRGVWVIAEHSGGVSSATLLASEAFAVGMCDGSVWIYERRDDEKSEMRVRCVKRLAPPPSASSGLPWRMGSRSEYDDRVTALRTTRVASGETLLLATHGYGGPTMAVWSASNGYEPIGDSGNCKGFASGPMKNTWIGSNLADGLNGTADGCVLGVSFDRKTIMCVGVKPDGKASLVWRSRREPGRQNFLAGVASIDRGAGFLPRVATCSCGELVNGTMYAAPDSPLKIVILDGADGSEEKRLSIEGLGASNVFIDCGSLCAVGPNLFLAHRDGSVWIINSGNGALITSLHPAQEFADTSGHKRILPSLLSVSPARDEMHGATCDGGVVNCWRVGIPTYWSTETHKNFPMAFRNLVKSMIMCAHVVSVSPHREFARLHMENNPHKGVVAEDDETERLAHVGGFVDVISREPALLEMVIARIARAEYGCDIVDGFH